MKYVKAQNVNDYVADVETVNIYVLKITVPAFYFVW